MSELTQAAPAPRIAQPAMRTFPDAAMIARLYRHARWLGARQEQADDLVQDALERLSRQPTWHDPARGSVETLLRIFIQSRLRDQAKQVATRTRIHGRLTVVSTLPSPHAAIATSAADAARQKLYAALGDEMQQVFAAWVRQKEGERAVALAAELDLSVAEFEAAKKRLRRRLKQLLQELDMSPADLTGGAR